MPNDEVLISELRKIETEACQRLANYLNDYVRDPEAFRARLFEFVTNGSIPGPEPIEDEEAFLHRHLENGRHIARDLIRRARGPQPG